MRNLTTKIVLILILSVFAFETGSAQQVVINFSTAPALTQNDVQTLVEKYQKMDIKILTGRLAEVKPDLTSGPGCKNAIAGLPDNWRSGLRVVSQVGDTRLWRIGEKAVKISGGQKYEFLYLDNLAPLAVSDSNCLMVVTSGMLRLTDNDDDALIGVMIHEMAHGLMTERSLSAKLKFNSGVRSKDYLSADNARYELAMIELECDLIAAKLLKESGRRIDGFAKLQLALEEAERKLNISPPVQFHPDGNVRKLALLSLKTAQQDVAVK
jgi:hypothetical protein